MKFVFLSALLVALGFAGWNGWQGSGNCRHDCSTNACWNSLSRCPIFSPYLYQGYSSCDVMVLVDEYKRNKHGGHGGGHSSGHCNTAWVGDGFCDHKCYHYNQDGGDCYGRTHDDAGHALHHSSVASGHGHGGHSSAHCNTAWVGDGYCDHKCFHHNQDGGDCWGKTHDDSGHPLHGSTGHYNNHYGTHGGSHHGTHNSGWGWGHNSWGSKGYHYG